MCAAAPYRVALASAWGQIRNRFVGRGILDASRAQSVRGRQGCRPLRWWGLRWCDVPPSVVGYDYAPMRWATVPGTAKRPPSATPSWGGDGGLTALPWGLRPLRRALRDDGGIPPAAAGGSFAPCAARVFRWLRPAGISPAAAGDQRLCLWKPRFFEKNRVKLLSFFSNTAIWGSSEISTFPQKRAGHPKVSGRETLYNYGVSSMRP